MGFIRRLTGLGWAVVAGVAMMLTMTVISPAQVMQIAGLAVAQDRITWNNLQDAAAGDNLVNGLPATALYGFDGTNWDRLPGDATNGLTVSLGANAGTLFFAIKDTGIAAASQNFAFGFTSKKVLVSAPSSNTAALCVDWAGGTAACAAADTAGDATLEAGQSILLDFFAQTSVSVIAASGTQTVNVQAWN